MTRTESILPAFFRCPGEHALCPVRVRSIASRDPVGSATSVFRTKKDALLLSMKLHIEYLQRLEDSKRVRQACLQYLQNWYDSFYPERSDLVGQLQELAATLGGSLEVPRLRWKYAWMKPLFGWNVAKWAQRSIPRAKAACIRQYDKMMYQMETSKQSQVLASTR